MCRCEKRQGRGKRKKELPGGKGEGTEEGTCMEQWQADTGNGGKAVEKLQPTTAGQKSKEQAAAELEGNDRLPLSRMSSRRICTSSPYAKKNGS